MRIIVLLNFTILLVGCNTTEMIRQAEERRSHLEFVSKSLDSMEAKNKKVLAEATRLRDSICKINPKECYENISNNPNYILTLKVQKASMSLSISRHVSDAMDAFEVSIPVDIRFYNKVNIGDEIGEGYNTGNFIMRGSNLSKTKIVVINKHIE